MKPKVAIRISVALYIALAVIVPSVLRADNSVVGAPQVNTTSNSVTIKLQISDTGPKAAGAPTITTFTPTTITAGTVTKAVDYSTTGNMTMSDATLPFSIKGTNLNGATITTTDPGVTFTVATVSADGTTASGTLKSASTARDGKLTATITNNAGTTATKDITVTITGTQYLKRTYQDKVDFKGDWSGVMPNDEVMKLKGYIDHGLSMITTGNYQKLGIKPVLYTSDVWKNSICKDPNVVGCAAPNDSFIYIQDEVLTTTEPTEFPDSVMLHESAHKLHFYNLGTYTGVPNMPTTTTGFETDWKNAVGDLSKCTYLPIVDQVLWNDKSYDDNTVPHCGFIWAYGAFNNNGDQTWYEDVATMTQKYVAVPDLFKSGEPATDPRYQTKVNLLKQYGFIH